MFNTIIIATWIAICVWEIPKLDYMRGGKVYCQDPYLSSDQCLTTAEFEKAIQPDVQTVFEHSMRSRNQTQRIPPLPTAMNTRTGVSSFATTNWLQWHVILVCQLIVITGIRLSNVWNMSAGQQRLAKWWTYIAHTALIAHVLVYDIWIHPPGPSTLSWIFRLFIVRWDLYVLTALLVPSTTTTTTKPEFVKKNAPIAYFLILTRKIWGSLLWAVGQYIVWSREWNQASSTPWWVGYDMELLLLDSSLNSANVNERNRAWLLHVSQNIPIVRNVQHISFAAGAMSVFLLVLLNHAGRLFRRMLS